MQHLPSCDGYLRDYRDGQLFKEHPLFSNDNQALQLIIYFDEVEVANPLGAHRGVHKLGKVFLILFQIFTILYV